MAASIVTSMWRYESRLLNIKTMLAGVQSTSASAESCGNEIINRRVCLSHDAR